MNNYITSDFYITALLLSFGHEILEISSTAGGKIKHFHFEDTSDLRKLLLMYMNGKLEGNLKLFKDAILTVKDMIHN